MKDLQEPLIDLIVFNGSNQHTIWQHHFGCLQQAGMILSNSCFACWSRLLVAEPNIHNQFFFPYSKGKNFVESWSILECFHQWHFVHSLRGRKLDWWKDQKCRQRWNLSRMPLAHKVESCWLLWPDTELSSSQKIHREHQSTVNVILGKRLKGAQSGLPLPHQQNHLDHLQHDLTVKCQNKQVRFWEIHLPLLLKEIQPCLRDHCSLCCVVCCLQVLVLVNMTTWVVTAFGFVSLAISLHMIWICWL